MIAVDPGVKMCGVAWFTGGRLVSAQWLSTLTVSRLIESPLVIEIPRIYPGSGQRKGDLNDLIDLALAAGRVIGARLPEHYVTAYPAQWKGQVPKKIMNARVLSRLTAEEKLAIQSVGAKDHNIIDAIGIGLWHLKRL